MKYNMFFATKRRGKALAAKQNGGKSRSQRKSWFERGGQLTGKIKGRRPNSELCTVFAPKMQVAPAEEAHRTRLFELAANKFAVGTGGELELPSKERIQVWRGF